MTMTYTDIYVAANMQYVQTCIQQIFQYANYTIQWKDQFSGTATRGSKGMHIAFGAVAEYSEVDFQIFAGPDQSTVVRLSLASSG